MKRFKKKLSVLLSGILALGIYMPPSTYATDAPEFGPVCNGDTGISITKSVEEIKGSDGNPNGQYRITFDIDGDPTEISEAPKAEVVLVMDISGSMNDEISNTDSTRKIEVVKNAAKDFCKTLLEKNPKAKISIVSYAMTASTHEKALHTSKLEDINDVIGTASYNKYGQWIVTGLKPNGGTNTEAGIKKAQEVLSHDSVDEDSKKYVVLFTDGLPTMNNYYNSGYYVTTDGTAVADNSYLPKPYLYFEQNAKGYVGYNYDNDFKGAQRAYNELIGGSGSKDIGGIGLARLISDYGRNPYVIAPKEEITLSPSPVDSNIKFYTMGLFTDNSTFNYLETTKLDKDQVQLQVSQEEIKEVVEEEVQLQENQEEIKEVVEQEVQLQVSQEEIKEVVEEEVQLQENQEEIKEVVEEEVQLQENQEELPYDFKEWEEDNLTIPNSVNQSTFAKKSLFSIQNAESNEQKYYEDYYTSTSDAISNLFKTIATEISAEISVNIAKNVTLTDTVTKYFELVPGLHSSNIDGKITYDNEDNSVVMNIGDIVDANSTDQQHDYTVSFVVKIKDPYYFGKGVPTNEDAILSYHTPDQKDNEPLHSDLFNKPRVNIHPIVGTINVSKVVQNSNTVNNIQEDTFSVLLKGINYNNISQGYEAEQYNFDLKHGETKSINFIMRSSVLYEKHVELDPYSVAYLNDSTNSQYKGLNYVTIGNYTANEIVPIGYELVSIDNSSFIVDKEHLNNSIVVTNKAETTNYFYDKESVTNVLDNNETTDETK